MSFTHVIQNSVTLHLRNCWTKSHENRHHGNVIKDLTLIKVKILTKHE